MAPQSDALEENRCDGVLRSFGLRQRRAPADEVGAFFSHHQYAGVDVCGDEIWHRRSITDAQAFDAMHFEIRVQYSILPDRAGAQFGAMPSLAPILKKITPAVVKIDIKGILPPEPGAKKRRGEIRAQVGAQSAEIEKIALADAGVQRHLAGLTVRKVIVVQDRIVNIVAA